MKLSSNTLNGPPLPPAERNAAISHLLVAIERMEGVRRRFEGYFFNCDLPRNLGLSYGLLHHLASADASSAPSSAPSSDPPAPPRNASLLLGGVDTARLRRASLSALSVYVNCPGAEPAVVRVAQSVLMGELSYVKMQFPDTSKCSFIKVACEATVARQDTSRGCRGDLSE
eukprot:CAMPEP_0172068116 /NCGR_PEP_ID=MMETSP1043-20130122/12047_1 /TAXON_ID=464988 /ORGANISM="Hemiselmis andersenii, Strain CCMP441" /LENGTH=170 /DNA_ID=CAMNT_0012728369 /DNA_START=24 /DNA_END=537 /DNA_ORIENTATION=+